MKLWCSKDEEVELLQSLNNEDKTGKRLEPVLEMLGVVSTRRGWRGGGGARL